MDRLYTRGSSGGEARFWYQRCSLLKSYQDLHCLSSKRNLKDFVIGDEKAKSSASKSVTVDKLNSGTTIEKSASKEIDAVPK